MNFSLICGCLVVSATLLMGQGGYIQEFYASRKLEKSDPKAAEEGMRRSFQLAIEAGNTDYATSAGISACHLIYGRGEVVATGRLAMEVLLALEPFPAEGPHGDAMRRAVLLGFVERGLLMEGKTGDAWRANRAVAETLRGKKVLAVSDGPSITVSEVIDMPKPLDELGWRLVEREAEYLDLAGRTLEGMALLDEAARHIKQLDLTTQGGRFYHLKVLMTRAMLRDFLGYEEEAMRLQGEILKIRTTDRLMRSSIDLTELNLLRNRSQWEGPSEELLAKAKVVGARMLAAGRSRGVEAHLAKMEADLRDSATAMETLMAEAEKAAEAGHLMDSLYAGRDVLVRRSRNGEKNLDGEYVGLLEKARAQGNKRAEPTLYREYANYLLDDERPAEACRMLSEALRLTRAFGWHLHEPALLTDLFQARLMIGDRVGAEAALTELIAWMERHADAPLARRIAAATGRVIALAQLGETEAAKDLLDKTRVEAAPLPEHRRRWLAPEMEALVLKARDPVAMAAGVVEAGPDMRVHPLGIGSIARPGGTARTRFTVVNTGGRRIAGHWEISGPGASYDMAGEILNFAAGRPKVDVKIPASIPAGDEAMLLARIVGRDAISTSEIGISWRSSGADPSPTTTWRIDWDPEATARIVMDASGLAANPFHSVPVFHELSVPPGDSPGIHFRLRSAVPLRFEYYQPESGRLLAIDANGNGDFTDAGDLFISTADGVAAALVPVSPAADRAGVEVRIHSPEGTGPWPIEGGQIIQAETFRDGVWVLEAENQLKSE